MLIHTASEGISFAKALEEEAATFYETAAERLPGLRDRGYAEENRRFAHTIQRVYQEVITDAIEGGYCFELETDEYTLPLWDRAAGSANDALRHAISIEKVMIAFYSKARDQAEGLMADIPRAFGVIVRKRRGRLEDLEAWAAGAA
ncbi:MAG: hypothetical protein AB7V19_03595 [Candidatus Bipolaricaulia bacterium]